MKRVKVAVVRQIISEEYFDVTMSDAVAAKLNGIKDDKDAVADFMTEEYQYSKRANFPVKYKETDVSDKVTFIKMKVVDVAE